MSDIKDDKLPSSGSYLVSKIPYANIASKPLLIKYRTRL